MRLFDRFVFFARRVGRITIRPLSDRVSLLDPVRNMQDPCPAKGLVSTSPVNEYWYLFFIPRFVLSSSQTGKDHSL